MANMIFKIKNVDNVDSFMESDEFKKFDDEVREYRKRVEQEHLDSLKNDTQKKVFTDWCNGICVSSEAYVKENNISKEDDYEAHSAILSVVSLGLG
jgi:isopentenyldiphosphate isomerase